MIDPKLPWGYPKFFSHGVTLYLDRLSLVIALTNELDFYGYSNAITYSCIPSSQMITTSKIMMNLAARYNLTPNSCHIVLYTSENVDFGYHTDEPLVDNTGFFVLRLGYSRTVEFLNEGSLSIQEGDVYVVRPSATNKPHRIPVEPLKVVKNILEKENPIFKPLEGRFISVAFVCRTVPIQKRHSYNGDEVVFVSFSCWSDLINSQPIPEEQPVTGIPTILLPNIEFDTSPDYKIVQVPVGQTWMGRHLLSISRAHTTQNSNISCINDCIISVLFGAQDILFGAKRIFSVTQRSDIIKFLKTLYAGSEIKVIINLDTCLTTTLDIKSTIQKKKLCWSQKFVHKKPPKKRVKIHTCISA